MNGKKAKAARRAAKFLMEKAGGDERRTYQRMKSMIKEPVIRERMYG
jgi:hypothetical protein